jgi:aryl-alcohol dehydrogenase-like predicted oxidoreductase
MIGATHYRHEAYAELRALMDSGRIQQIQIPYNARDQLAAREILPVAAELGLGVLAMRPFGEGTLLRRPPAAKELEPLHRFGITSWPQALLKWIISDPRVHCAIPATSRPERMRANAAAGELPLLDDEARSLIASLARE